MISLLWGGLYTPIEVKSTNQPINHSMGQNPPTFPFILLLRMILKAPFPKSLNHGGKYCKKRSYSCTFGIASLEDFCA